MKKTTSKALASVALTGLIAGIIPVGQVSAAANTDFTRLSGKDRYLTAVEVSKAGWVEGAEYAVVANGEAYADALSAAPFAKKNNAPILLTSSKGITNETINELKRLKVKKVYVIGETGVVPNSILEAIKKNVTIDVERIGGQDRYETSVKIAEKLGTVTEAILASGEGYADALSAAPVAATKGIPVLLTRAGELSKATSDYIKTQDIETTFVVGGTASVSDKVKGLVPNAVRFGGKNRFETNAEIIKGFALDFNFDEAYVALANGPTGKEFADALTASAIAAKGGHPVIISNKTADAATTALIGEKLSPTAKITAIGGAANLSDALVKSYQVKGETIKASKDVTGNAVVTEDNVELRDMKVTGNLYLEGNNATLNNVEVTGTLFVNPGEEGNAEINDVKADKIVVLSGANKSIHFNNVTSNYLLISSKTQTRIVFKGIANINNMEVFSQAILDATSEFKGNVIVLNSLYARNIEFLGEYSGTITVKGNKDGVKLPDATPGPIGGGGGGGTTTPAADPLKDKIERAIEIYEEFAKNNPGQVSEYPTVDYTANNKTITITIDESKEDKLISETFDAKGSTVEESMVTEARLERLETLMANSGLNIGGKSLAQYIASSAVLESYKDGDKLDYKKIAEKFATGEFNFAYLEAAFNTALDKVENEGKVVPEVTAEGLTLQSISEKDGGTITLNDELTYQTFDAKVKEMLGDKASYAEVTYGDFEGTYTLTFKDAEEKTVTYKVVVNFN